MKTAIRARAYLECSAKMQLNVEEVFEQAILTVLHPEASEEAVPP
jgi:GTPase SAR1 family protein